MSIERGVLVIGKRSKGILGVALCMLAVCTPILGTTLASAAPEPKKTVNAIQGKQIDDLQHQITENETVLHLVLSPIAVLVAILALGGSLGIVFSIRDQRRVSQLHELTVGSETLSQKRAEQSYASFFDQSQTTLALVNDTLELAKEATEGATHSMELKAKAQIDSIEERAEALLDRVFGGADFESLVEDAGIRGDLHAIGDALRSLEGYLSLQNITLPQHTKFIKAIDQFLLDDTEGAIHALRRASQERLGDELRRFTLFWLGYMYTTVADYELAIRTFREDEIGLSNDDTERFQLECIIAETRFFEIAKTRRGEEMSAASGQSKREPWERLKVVAPLLDELSALAVEIAESKDQRNLQHVSLEVARTRADIYTWIAYDPERIDDPVKGAAIKQVSKVRSLAEASVDKKKRTITSAVENRSDGGSKTRQVVKLKSDASAVEFVESPAWNKLKKPDDVRAWAHRQAGEICKVQPDPNFYVSFALAESHFMLKRKGAKKAFEAAEEALSNEFGEHREKRRNASLDQSALICHSRLHHLESKSKQRRKEERQQVQGVSRRAKETVNGMRQGRVTVFSQIQRRNITRAEFVSEVNRIVFQDKLDGESDT